MDTIKAELEELEGFRVDHDEMILKVYHWGTEVGVAYHYGSYLDITPSLINELAKQELNLEGFMVDNDIYYQLIKPKSIKYPKIKLGLNHKIVWSQEKGFEYSGLIDGYHFYYRRNYYHGDYIEIIYNYCPYYSYGSSTPQELNSYFEAIWREIESSERLPLEPSLGSKVASYLPWGFKAYKVEGSADSQCKIQRTVRQYCYLKKFGNQYYISPTENWQLQTQVTTNLFQALKIALQLIDSL
ncbi:MAG: hypothetical protein F6K08_26260 [Okeania sp. SIO1H6]|nr:hypothetical protein [Okeania sp. SIO1H6]